MVLNKIVFVPALAIVASTFVGEHGRLSLGGKYKTQIVDENGNAVQLRGISTFSPPYFANCIEQDAFKYMAGMGASMVRIAMDADTQYWDAVDQASAAGLYVLIDYHYIGKKPIADDNAKNFFRTAAQRFHTYNNIIYELFNEPADMAWSELKQYHEAMLAVIRPIDPLALVVAGTPAWSGKTDAVVGNTINDDKVLYTKHFYAASHHDQDAIGQLLSQVPVFVTEWGICSYTGDGALDYNSAQAWQNMMNGGNQAGVWVSWANWGWDDKGESCSYLNPGSCDAHSWGSHSASGSHVDGYLKAAGPPSGHTTPAPSPGGTCSQQNGNNKGDNLMSSSLQASGAAQCCDLCSQHAGCAGYTYIGANGECWLKSRVDPIVADAYAISGTYSAPHTTPAPTPATTSIAHTTTAKHDCPGGSLEACVGGCPTSPEAVLKVCTKECEERCGGSGTSCGNDDGNDLSHCIAHCPTDGDEFHTCVACCGSKFPSAFEV